MPQQFSDQPKNSLAVPDLPPDLHVLDYVAFLFRRKWLVLSCVLLFAAGFVGASYMMPYTYTSQVRLLPPDRLSSAGLLNSLNASGALLTLKEVENPSVDVIQNLLEARSVCSVVARDSAIHSFLVRNSDEAPADVILQSIDVHPGVTFVDVIARLSTGWLSSAADKENARRLSQRVASLCVSVMDSMLTSHLQGDVRQHWQYAESDYREKRAELDSLERIQEQFERQNGIVQLKEQTTQAIVQLAGLKSEEALAEAEAASLSGDFAINARRRKEAGDRVIATRFAVERFKSQPDFSIAFNELPEVGRAYASLLIRVRSLEPVVIYLQREAEQAKIDVERRRSLITVLDPAQTPEVRSSPKRLPMLLLGLFSGFVLSILILAVSVMVQSWRARANA
jgi:tyrosine-protein kinase Etk/Wzc